MPALPSHSSAQAETAIFVAASSTTDLSVDCSLKLPLTKQDFVGVGGEHNAGRLVGHHFGVDVSVGSVVQNSEQNFADRGMFVGSVEQESKADEHILVGEQECRIGGE